MRSYRIAVIAGDGIGPEVIGASIPVLDRVAIIHGFQLAYEYFPWGSQYYLDRGRMMPPSALETLEGFHAIYLGAVGDPRVSDDVTLRGLLLPIRQGFVQYVNARPAVLYEGVASPLAAKKPCSIDCLVIRENTEGEYSNVGGRVHRGSRDEVAIQTGVFTRSGIERIIRYAFDAAAQRRMKLTSVTKSNAQGFSMVLWDEVFATLSAEYTNIETYSILVDAACMALIQRPEDFDVIVASNLYGDIISEITATVTGSIGLAPSSNLNPTCEFPSMFEPVHGSAPDIAGTRKANPIAAILAGKAMLAFLGEQAAAGQIEAAVAAYLARGEKRTPDLGGSAETSDVTREVLSWISTLQTKETGGTE